MRGRTFGAGRLRVGWTARDGATQRRTWGVACLAVLAAAVVALPACRRSEPAPGATAAASRQYDLRGQVIDVRPDIGEIRIRHEAIPGYMDAMTMSFAVKDRRLLRGRAPGDLVTATLVVTDSDAWLATLDRTGTAPLIDDEEAMSAPAPASPLLEPGDAVPDETFVDQDGKPWRPSALAGRAYALTFIYTRCPLPTYCPLMDREFRTAQQTLSPALRDRVRFVTVSFDPDFDTPRVLRAHAAAIRADLETWTFVTAKPDVVDAFGARFGFSVMRGDGSPAGITHNLRTAIVAPTGELVKIYNGNDWTATRLVHDLETAAALR